MASKKKEPTNYMLSKKFGFSGGVDLNGLLASLNSKGISYKSTVKPNIPEKTTVVKLEITDGPTIDVEGESGTIAFQVARALLEAKVIK